MGLSKGGGYDKLSSVTPQQQTFLDQIMGQAGGNMGQAAQGFAQFLPGGGGGEAIAKQAEQRFQQQTVPGIQQQYGAGAKTSSALNQALAGGAANLNTDVASMLSQAQLQAAQGLGQLGTQQGQLGTQQQFAYQPKQQPFWQQALLAGLAASSGAGKEFVKGKMGAYG